MKPFALALVVVSACGCTAAARARFDARMRGCRGIISDARLDREYVQRSYEDRESSATASHAREPSQSPGRLYALFARMNDLLLAAEQKGCPTSVNRVFASTGTSFADEWRFQESMEASRVETLADLRRAADEAAAAARVKAESERKAWQEELSAKATRHGFRVVLFDESLTDVLDLVISGGAPLDRVKGVVIEMDDWRDKRFTAQQDLGRGSALYTSDATDAVVILRNYGETIIEGSPLTSLRNSYVTIRGVTRYRSVLGTKQAFVVETAW